MAGVCRFLESRTMYQLFGKVVVWAVVGVLAITVMDAITHPEVNEDGCNFNCAVIVRYIARHPPSTVIHGLSAAYRVVLDFRDNHYNIIYYTRQPLSNRRPVRQFCFLSSLSGHRNLCPAHFPHTVHI